MLHGHTRPATCFEALSACVMINERRSSPYERFRSSTSLDGDEIDKSATIFCW